MQIRAQQAHNMDGFVYVASQSRAFYKAAVNSAISLRDFYPEANITLFTHPEFMEDRDHRFFNNIHLDIPYNIRSKMFGMSRTPYEKTLYLDADTEIRSDKIKNVFDILSDNDIMFTKILPHVSKDADIDAKYKLEYHGGIILYNNNKLTLELMSSWYKLYQYQRKCVWKDSIFSSFSKKMSPWDQFTMWYLLFKDTYFSEIKHDFFPNGGHDYNFIHLLELNMKSNIPYQKLEQIIYHYTIPSDAITKGYLDSNTRQQTNYVLPTNQWDDIYYNEIMEGLNNEVNINKW